MLRGLIYRQLFLIADVALAICIVFIAVYAVMQGVSSERREKSVPPAVTPDDYAEVFADPAGREAFDIITASGMFGDAANKTADYQPPKLEQPAVVETEKETTLPLSLSGTVVEGLPDPLASAIIEVREGGAPTMQTYFVGEEIVSRVILKEVRRKEVVLENRRTMTTEYLRMDDEAIGIRMAKAAPPPRPEPTATASTGQEIVEIDRQSFVQQLADNYEQIATEVDVREELDGEGNVIGLSASNISDIQLAQDLGLNDGDILTTVNNERVDSVDKVFEIVNKYRNARSFRLGIIRDGRTQTISYRLR